MDVREKLASEKRLIDANALLRHKRKMSGADFGGEFWDEAVLTSDIKNATTVDAVEVVRCRECKHFLIVDETFCMRRYMCTVNHFSYLENDGDNHFCSYGERKEGAD